MSEIKWYNKPGMIVAFSALFISVITAAAEIYSAYSDRVYARASAWPRLEVLRTYGPEHFEFIMTNVGTGPALIKYAKIKYDSKIIHRWNDIPEMPSITQSHVGNRIMPAEKMINPISYKGNNTEILFSIEKKLTMELCYCSIYHECWIIHETNRQNMVEVCEINESDKFLQ